MPGASVEALRRYQRGEPASESAPAAILTALRNLRAQNSAANAQHLADLGSMGTIPGGTDPSVRARAIDQVASGMDIGGLTAFHGSPARFTKFDPSKVGTGEGAQVYGQGLYLAGNKAVADQYRRGLPMSHVAEKMEDAYNEWDSPTDAYRQLMTDPSIPKDQKKLLMGLKRDDWLGFYSPAEAIQNLRKYPGDWDLSPMTQRAQANIGNMYSVDLPDPHVAQMLDWNTPLYQQDDVFSKIASASNDPDKAILRQAFDAYNDSRKGMTYAPITGSSFHNTILSTAPHRAAENQMANEMARALQESGIPGIKYLDQGSRGRNPTKTSNYVVFPEYQKDLTILDRNGIPLTDNYNTWGLP